MATASSRNNVLMQLWCLDRNSFYTFQSNVLKHVKMYFCVYFLQ